MAPCNTKHFKAFFINIIPIDFSVQKNAIDCNSSQYDYGFKFNIYLGNLISTIEEKIIQVQEHLAWLALLTPIRSGTK